jgi:hypothetical protein
MRFSADLNYDWNVVGDEDITYTLVGTELQRNGQIVAYDIEAAGFAYAFDDDDDGVLDQSGGGNIIWAVDSNLGDDKLDNLLDTNDDGIIDENDTEGGANMAGQVDIDRIRAVRIWLLARTRQPIKGHTDNQTYAVGAKHEISKPKHGIKSRFKEFSHGYANAVREPKTNKRSGLYADRSTDRHGHFFHRHFSGHQHADAVHQSKYVGPLANRGHHSGGGLDGAADFIAL